MENTRLESAQGIVRRFSYYGAAGGFLPLPVVDMALVAGVQTAMVSELAGLYGVPFKGEIVKAILPVVLGAVLPEVGREGAMWAVGSALKSIPLVGTIFGMAVSTAAAGVTTRIIGKIFIMHFEAGGTLLDFNPEKMKSYFTGAVASEPVPQATA